MCLGWVGVGGGEEDVVDEFISSRDGGILVFSIVYAAYPGVGSLDI
jgi:hypothetical protein